MGHAVSAYGSGVHARRWIALAGALLLGACQTIVPRGPAPPPAVERPVDRPAPVEQPARGPSTRDLFVDRVPQRRLSDLLLPPVTRRGLSNQAHSFSMRSATRRARSLLQESP